MIFYTHWIHFTKSVIHKSAEKVQKQSREWNYPTSASQKFIFDWSKPAVYLIPEPGCLIAQLLLSRCMVQKQANRNLLVNLHKYSLHISSSRKFRDREPSDTCRLFPSFLFYLSTDFKRAWMFLLCWVVCLLSTFLSPFILCCGHWLCWICRITFTDFLQSLGSLLSLYQDEPQNHWTVETGRDLLRSKQDQLEHVVQDCVQSVFEYLQRWRLHNLPGQPEQPQSHTLPKEVRDKSAAHYQWCLIRRGRN